MEEWLRDQSVRSGKRAKDLLPSDAVLYWRGREEAFLIAADVLRAGVLPAPIN